MALEKLTAEQFEQVSNHIGFILPDGEIWAGLAGDYDPVDILFELADMEIIELPDMSKLASGCGHPEDHLVDHMVEVLGYVGWRKSHGEYVLFRPECDD